jgi:hypothetical protein
MTEATVKDHVAREIMTATMKIAGQPHVMNVHQDIMARAIRVLLKVIVAVIVIVEEVANGMIQTCMIALKITTVVNPVVVMEIITREEQEGHNHKTAVMTETSHMAVMTRIVLPAPVIMTWTVIMMKDLLTTVEVQQVAIIPEDKEADTDNLLIITQGIIAIPEEAEAILITGIKRSNKKKERIIRSFFLIEVILIFIHETSSSFNGTVPFIISRSVLTI